MKKISKVEQDKRLIRSAMARNGIDTYAELAELSGMGASVISNGMRGGFTQKSKVRLNKVLRFTDEEKEILAGW